MKRAQQGPPQPESETPAKVESDVIADVEEALSTRHGAGLVRDETLRLDARTGVGSAWLKARIGTDDRAYEAEVFVRGIEGELFEGALGFLVDYLDGLLEEWIANDRDAWLPLDWDAREYEDVTVFARGDLRDYRAEREADRLLTSNGHSSSS